MMEKEIFYKLLDREVKPANFMHINACSYAFSNLLSNRTNILVMSTKRIWDVMPGSFIALEAGIKTYSYKNLNIFSNSKDFDEIIKKIH